MSFETIRMNSLLALDLMRVQAFLARYMSCDGCDPASATAEHVMRLRMYGIGIPALQLRVAHMRSMTFARPLADPTQPDLSPTFDPNPNPN